MIKVELQPLAPRHAEALQRIASHPRVQAMTLLPDPYPPEGAASFIAYARGAWGREFNWAVVSTPEASGETGPETVGCATLKEIHDGQGDCGYYIDPARWGEGFATDAVRQVCRFAFEDLVLWRVTAHPLAENVASCRVLEKAGFVLEQTMRNPFAKWSPEARVARYVRDAEHGASPEASGASTNEARR